MSKSSTYAHHAEFLGVDNIHDKTKVSMSSLTVGENVDLDDIGLASRRDGYGCLTTTPSHSVWTDGIDLYFVQGTTLYRLNADNSSTAMRTGLTAGLRMSYVVVNKYIVFSNSMEIGYLFGGNAYAVPTPSDPLKYPMPAGHILEFHGGRLYSVKGGVVTYSDAANYFTTTRRKNFLHFPARVTLFRSVSGGIFVSYGGATYFMAGETPEELNLKMVEPHEAIEGTDVFVDNIGMPGNQEAPAIGSYIMWSSTGGVCVGGDGGLFRNITSSRYKMPSASTGCGVLRKTAEEFYQYIAVLQQ